MIERMSFLKAAENRESFFARIALLFPTRDPRYKAIERAYNYAKDAFREKYRDDGETRYFEHIRAVVLIMIDYLRIKDYTLIIDGILHDIVEDIPSWSIDRVDSEFGPQVALDIEWITKMTKSGLSKDRQEFIYHSRFPYAPRRFWLIKLPDRLHNMITLWTCPQEKILRKIEETKRHYLPYAERELILLHELEEAIEIIESRLKINGG
ncbi:MAG TPA: HD domain-containing protein [Candidatus Paceibacterota bacterium]